MFYSVQRVFAEKAVGKNIPVLKRAMDAKALVHIGSYRGQQLGAYWKSKTRKLCGITFGAPLILHYSKRKSAVEKTAINPITVKWWGY